MAGRGSRTSTTSSTSTKASSAKRGGGDAASRDDAADSCNLSFRAALQGLDREVVKKLKMGDVLSVEKVDSKPFPSVVCRIIKNGETVGSLASSDKTLNLMACIVEGNVYRAKVIDLARGCSVQVYRQAKGASK